MRIGVVGDTHNQMINVDRIVSLFREAHVERVVHTGDITQPNVLDRFASLEAPLLGVFGNNDRHQRARLAAHASRFGMDLTDPPRRIEWAGRRILVAHDPEEVQHALPAEIDLVLHGHTHRHRLEQRGGTLFFNPGECAGTLAGTNAVGLVDLVSLEAQRLRF
ncbi:MAG: hypothetical protein CL908_27275 [Deltaproteobacteria bacterium]|nr:hypothetical protein [Deltaproteobacteria bacterium]